jgi:phosphoribosylaminoimidazole-succinocarboxamide synthase
VTDRSSIIELDLPLQKVASGKVREIYELDLDHLLFIATDRISAFDVVMTQGIPDKGRLLSGISLFWFDFLSDICPNHLVEPVWSEAPKSRRPWVTHPSVQSHEELLSGRSMVVRRLDMLPVEFVVRGYLAGSGWADYKSSGAVCGIPLPPGLRQADKLPEPIFTPSTKATTGHDENISEDQAADLCGPDILKTAKDYALRLYLKASEFAQEKGIILADTKFEFGLLDGEVVVGDEVLTPDSSRFWPSESWKPGSSPPSFDKQYLRDWLEGSQWGKEPPPPDLPKDVIVQTRARYVEAFEQLTGTKFDSYAGGLNG